MATYKISQVESVEAEDVLKSNLDFKTMYNIEFTEVNSNILLLKKMLLNIHNRLSNVEDTIKAMRK